MRPGRHRRGADGRMWTPAVPPRPEGNLRRHELADPVDAPVSGSLPLPPAPSASAAFRGELPVPPLARPLPPLPQPSRPRVAPPHSPPPRAGGPARELPPEPPPTPRDLAPLRTRVTLNPPARRRSEEIEDDDVRVYLAPLPDGLGKFDLGSVPASVTPPKTWRKAAWFATLSSGGVVVAMLFAGSMLVGKPADPQAVTGWPGLQGGQPLLNGEVPADTSADPPSTSRDRSTTRETPPPDGIDTATVSIEDAAPVVPPAPAPTSGSSTTTPGEGAGPASPTTHQRPSRPPVAPAEREVEDPPFFYAFSFKDAKKMGDASENFLNKVTEDPAAAAAMCGGKLEREGAKGLAKSYAGIAYFEVKTIKIDEGRGTTVNTVKTVYRDGTTTTEQLVFSFSDDNKITDDGR
jgi:hypothetical protein